MPGNTQTRDRASFPTVDAVGGQWTPKAPETAPADPFAIVPESVLGVTAEHAGRYVPHAAGELGRGGIGRVYVAADRHLEREVAVKELLLDRAEASAPAALSTLVRFLREARITGKLEHPNIVPVHELGRRADGSLYYTMRVVRGRTLARALADTQTLAERLKLLDHFIDLSQAIAYAHSRGVVHRDIKPDNVMIGEFGETVVLDWGMAKLRAATVSVGSDGTVVDRLDDFGPNVTMEGSLCGTPTHMSPEQARGALDEVDERSDVWALGVVLYTILTGRTPFHADTLPELIRRVRDGEHRSPRAVNGDIPAELSAIAERALRRDPQARYQTATELLRDVEAYRSGARVGAYEYTSVDLLRRFLERHRTAVVASVVGLCVTLLLAIASYVRLAAARDRAREAERRATENERVARASERSAKESLSLVLVEKAEQAILEDDRTDAELLAAEALKLGERADARGLAIAADSAFRPEPVFSLATTAGCTGYAMAYAPALLACSRSDGISVYGLRDGALRLHAPSSGAPTTLELSEDGKTLLRVLGGELALLDLQGGGRALLERRVGPISAAALSSNGKLLAWAMQNLVVVSEARDSGSEWRLHVGQRASALAFSPDAQTLVVGGELGLTTLWDFRSDRSRQLAGHTGTVRALAFAQQGRYLATGAADRSVRIWDTRDGVSVAPPLVHSDAITSLALTADARMIAFGSRDKSFHVVELKDGGRRAEVRFHGDSVDWLALAPDGSEVASVSRDLGLEKWSLASLRTPSALVGHGNVLSFAFVPGTDELVSAGLGTEGVGVWNVDSGLCRTRLPAGIDRVRALAVSGDGRRLAFAGSEGRTLLWDLPAGVPLRVFDGSREDVRAVAFSRDGRSLAFAGLDGVVHVSDTETFSPIAELEVGAPVQALAFSNAENVLVSGDRDGMLSLWDIGRQRRLSRFKAHDDWALAVAIARDGTRIASAGADRRIRIWNAATGALAADLAGHEGRVFAVDFSSDGQLLASGAEDKTARLWSVGDARELAVLTGHTAAVRAVHFAAGRPLLATAGDDGVTRLWRLATLFEPGATLSERVRSRYKVGLTGTHVTRLPGP